MGFDSIITKINSCIEIEDQIWYKTGSTFNSDISSKAMTSKIISSSPPRCSWGKVF